MAVMLQVQYDLPLGSAPSMALLLSGAKVAPGADGPRPASNINGVPALQGAALVDAHVSSSMVRVQLPLASASAILAALRVNEPPCTPTIISGQLRALKIEGCAAPALVKVGDGFKWAKRDGSLIDMVYIQPYGLASEALLAARGQGHIFPEAVHVSHLLPAADAGRDLPGLPPGFDAAPPAPASSSSAPSAGAGSPAAMHSAARAASPILAARASPRALPSTGDSRAP